MSNSELYPYTKMIILAMGKKYVKLCERDIEILKTKEELDFWDGYELGRMEVEIDTLTRRLEEWDL